MPTIIEELRSRAEDLRSRVRARREELFKGSRLLGGSSNPGNSGNVVSEMVERARSRITEIRERIESVRPKVIGQSSYSVETPSPSPQVGTVAGEKIPLEVQPEERIAGE